MLRECILEVIDTARPGLEIGALDRPIVPRSLGPVEYVDRATREGLLEAYKGHEVDHAAIVEVDHVWGEQSLLQAVGGRRAYAYVLASHVIEHVPDLFGWLREIASVLEDGGVAAFIVPDKRFTFDILRRTSSPAELADAYVRKLRRPDPRQIFDHVVYTRNTDQDGVLADPLTVLQEREALDFCQRVHDGQVYIDVHCWVFTPRSMVEALDLGSRLGLLPFEIARLEPTAPGSIEFLLALRRLPEDLDPSAQRAAFEASLARLDLPAEAEHVGAHVRLLAGQAEAALARVAAIEASTSWRLTAPLRAAVDRLRGH
jgi:hypothetical protein